MFIKNALNTSASFPTVPLTDSQISLQEQPELKEQKVFNSTIANREQQKKAFPVIQTVEKITPSEPFLMQETIEKTDALVKKDTQTKIDLRAATSGLPKPLPSSKAIQRAARTPKKYHARPPAPVTMEGLSLEGDLRVTENNYYQLLKYREDRSFPEFLEVVRQANELPIPKESSSSDWFDDIEDMSIYILILIAQYELKKISLENLCEKLNDSLSDSEHYLKLKDKMITLYVGNDPEKECASLKALLKLKAIQKLVITSPTLHDTMQDLNFPYVKTVSIPPLFMIYSLGFLDWSTQFPNATHFIIEWGQVTWPFLKALPKSIKSLIFYKAGPLEPEIAAYIQEKFKDLDELKMREPREE